ncbi:MAG TPA: hypothetical protein VL547_23880 [Dinghuibacter sp.]|jgi:hypothetical protein|uniref:hypothetical protein n=1 Tax=Dinghuibacter sp. TaxID=2024697 RepID=UPI002BD66835|nr:hypothetical protein [Dinghuibacter sp.]HTJ15106.1 hypothetical protein [Dinghuibacter sp.]
MATDPRFEAAKALIETGKLIKFNDLFEIIPKSVMAEEISHSYASFVAKMENPQRWTLGNVSDMATVIGIPADELAKVIFRSIKRRPNKE